jgi:putative phosphoribosyl transferase
MPFADRTEAGKRLAAALEQYRDTDAVVLALPRGGLPVAAEVATHLNIPLDLLLVRKIGVPTQPELAMGAVVDGSDPFVVRNEHVIRVAWVSAAEFERAQLAEMKELERRRECYLAGREPIDVTGRTAIIVDDGIATGATVRAAVGGLRQRKAGKIVVATPVAQPETVAELGKEADDVVCLEQPEVFSSIGFFYRDFRQLSDDEVISMLKAFEPAPGAGSKSAG